MPAEPSYLAHGVNRRVSRKPTSEDEIDIRRARGEISCAECRRFVLADTTQLHTKIAEMGQRIRQLEDALAIFQSGISSETHPLLRDELLAIKFGPDKGHLLEKEEPLRDSSVDSIDALGTLAIGDQGQVKYFGRSAGSEAGAELDKIASGFDNDPALEVSPEVSQLSNAFPFGTHDSSERLEKSLELLLGYLPSQPRAWSLCETYMEHATWVFRPIRRDEIIDEILSPIYKSLRERRAAESLGPHTICPHKLAVLFLVFALGALVDLTLEPYRDSARFNMEAKTVQRRRALFWELFSAELFSSLATGRPPSIRLSYIDCEFPEDDEASIDKDGNILKGYYQWKYEFTKEIFSTVTELTLTAEPPHYQTVLDLDRKVREKLLPSHLNVFMSPEDEHCTPSVYMRGCLLAQYRTVSQYASPAIAALLYIHRSFFAQAMLDHPTNPLRSPYAPSFLAAYRCASGVIKSNLNHFDRFPDLCCRWWNIWTHLFSAAIIVGTIVTRSPSSSMAPSAFIELGLACDLFEKGASQSRRARSGLAILGKLREKAFQVYSQFRSGNPTTNAVLSVGKPDYGDDELALFGGQTRVLVSKLLNTTSSRKQSISYTHSTDSGAGSPTEPTPDVHPSLVEYLSNIPHDYTNPSSPHQSSGTSYPPQNMFQHNGTYLPSDHEIQPPWPPSAPYSSSPINQSSYLNGTSGLPNPDMPFGSMPDYDNPAMQSDPPENLIDLGMMMTGDSGMDEQWMSFMRDSGLLEGNFNNALSHHDWTYLPVSLLSQTLRRDHQNYMRFTMPSPKTLNGTDLIHYDALSNNVGPEVAPSISVTTTFRAPEPVSAPIDPQSFDMRNPPRHVYSRYTQQVSTRAEHILSRINDGYALTYASGLAASYAALVFYKPKRIAIRGGYHGCHATIETYKKAKDAELQVIDLDEEYQPGDLCWLETPLNPTGEARDMQYYADKIHKVGGSLLVDSTFAPPPLQYPFNFGADCVFHSGTKYFGGHSDLLCGVLVVKTREEWNSLHHDRTFLGSMMGSLEAWLLLRSLRTLHLRIARQSETVTIIASWLSSVSNTPKGQYFDGVPGGVVAKVWHSSLQGKDARGFEPKSQLTGGWNPTFAFIFEKPEYATHFPHLLKYFVPATSLGGVESLAEHRLQSDAGADPRLIRLSIGVEEVEDLKADLRQALVQVTKVKAKL
ncbi:hypothetical protein DXG01_010576 [Tephrocybe rancida]|nr:hypothetical protein DXG01_010576 [Tephrocybe rancida]